MSKYFLFKIRLLAHYLEYLYIRNKNYLNFILFSVKVWYILMEPFAGGLASLLILTIFVKSGQYVAAEALVFGMPVWKAALVIHVTAWIIQFIGHGIFEGISRTIKTMQKRKNFHFALDGI